jgi:hypothetical protein
MRSAADKKHNLRSLAAFATGTQDAKVQCKTEPEDATQPRSTPWSFLFFPCREIFEELFHLWVTHYGYSLFENAIRVECALTPLWH